MNSKPQYIKLTEGGAIPLSYDLQSFQSKPTKKQAGGISKRIVSHKPFLTLQALADHVIQGKSFSPALFNGTRNKEGWFAQQMIVLDIDENCSWHMFQRDCERMGLFPCLAYKSFSWEPLNQKFRAVFLMDGLIVDHRMYLLVNRIFMDLFPYLDKAAFRKETLYFGTCHPDLLLPPNGDRVSLENLFCAWTELHKVDDPQWHRTMKGRCKKIGVSMEGDFLSLKAVQFGMAKRLSISSQDLYYIKGVGANLTNTYPFDLVEFDVNLPQLSSEFSEPEEKYIQTSYIEYETPKPSQLHQPTPSKPIHRRSSKVPVRPTHSFTAKHIQQLKDLCNLFRVGMDGKIKLNHHEKYHWMDNMLPFRTGQMVFLNAIAANPFEDQEALGRWKDRIKWAQEHDYSVQHCSKLKSDHCKGCVRYGNTMADQILSSRQGGKHFMTKLEDEQKNLVSLETKRSELKKTIQEIFAVNDNKVYVVKVEPGVGKTHEILEWPLTGCGMYFPTHRLKQQAIERAYQTKPTREIFEWPEMPDLPSPWGHTLNRIKDIQYGDVQGILHEFLEDPEAMHLVSLKNRVANYLKAIKDVHTEKTVFGTHAKALNGLAFSKAHHTVIFDEDILDSLIQITEIRREDLEQLRMAIDSLENHSSVNSQFVEPILQGNIDILTPLPKQTISTRTLSRIMNQLKDNIQTPVHRIFDAEALLIRQDRKGKCHYHILRTRPLPQDKKVIILSATADFHLYESIFGERLKFHDLTGVELKSHIHLHHSRSFTKSSIEAMKWEDFVSLVAREQETHNFEGIITHKKYSESRNGELYLKGSDIRVIATFGALEGLDDWKGKNIAVFGTPHVDESTIRLFHYGVTGKVTLSRLDFEKQAKKKHGFTFTMNSPKTTDPMVHRIQEWFIQTGLIQAIGRARPHNEEAEIHVYANFPIQGAILEDMKAANQ